jgi:hypothetical protein
MLSDQLLEGFDVSAIVARLVDGSFGDEGRVGEAEIVEQDAEGFDADSSLPDLLVAVEFRSAGGFGIVAVDYFYIVQADGGIEVLHGSIEALFADDVVAGDVSVAGVDAGCDWNNTAEAVDDFGDLLEAASERKLGACGVLDQNGKAGLGEVKALRGGSDGGGRLQETGFAIRSAKGAGVEDEIIGADGEGALDFAAESFDGFSQEQFVGAGEIHQVIGVDDERLEIVLRPQLEHLLAQRVAEFVGCPLTRAGRENLQRVASDTVSALGGVVDSSGGGGVNADAAGSEAGPAFWRSTSENILFASEEAGHEVSIKGSLREPDGRVARHHTIFASG